MASRTSKRRSNGPTGRFGPVVIISCIVLVVWLVVAVFAPWIAPHDPAAFVSEESFASAGGGALLGTDYLGRDTFSRLLVGARLTLGMSLCGTILAMAIGGFLGVFAALLGGWVDALISRTFDVILSLPKIIVGLVAVAALGSSFTVIVSVVTIVYSSGVFLVARSLGDSMRELDFIRAARLRGEGHLWIIFGEILPNIYVPLATDFAVRLGYAVLFISSLSFLGLGVQPPAADWGALAKENLSGLLSGSWASVWPAIAVASVTVSLSFIVDHFGDRSAARREQ